MKKTKISLCVALAVCSMNASAVLYGTTGFGGTTSTLVELNETTGALVRTIGSVGYAVNGLTFDAATGTLFATTSTNDGSFPNGLISINTSTGAGTQIGTGAGRLVNVATANSSGGLYGWTESGDDPVVWNKTSGTVSVIGNAGISTYTQSLAFDNNDVLYILNGDQRLYSVNLTTGATTLVGQVNGVTSNTAHHGDFNTANKLYAINTTSGGVTHIYVIDIATLTVVDELTTVNDLFTLAFAGASSTMNVFQSVTNVGNRAAAQAAGVIDANSNLQSLFSGLTTDQQVSNAATQTLPLLFGASAQVAQAIQGNINQIIRARQFASRGQSSGDGFFGNKNLWFKPFGSLADQQDRNGVAGYKATTYGMAFGMDASLSKDISVGGAFAYAKSDVDGQSPVAPQNAKIDVYQLIGYGSYNIDDRTALDFQIGFGQNDNKGSRMIAFTSAMASSDFSSETAHVGVNLGRRFSVGSQTSLTPSVRVDYTWIKDKSYSETGAGLLNLNVNSRTSEALIVGADGKLAHQLNDQTSIFASLGVGYDTIGKQAAITAAYAGAPGAAFVTYGIDPSPWLGRGAAGAVYKTKSGLEITARYDVEARESFLNQTASVKASWTF